MSKLLASRRHARAKSCIKDTKLILLETCFKKIIDEKRKLMETCYKKLKDKRKEWEQAWLLRV